MSTTDEQNAAHDAMAEVDQATQQGWIDMLADEEYRKLKARELAKQRLTEENEAAQRAAHPDGRWMNLDEYLDGEYEPPTANLGATREDGTQFLYRGRWHTMIGLTTTGKTFFACWQAKHVMEWGGHVIYIHFEEPNPAGTIARLIGMGVNKETIRKQFHWPENRPWTRGEMTQEIERLPVTPELAILDGINAACGDHGWDVSNPSSVGVYRAMFVHPVTEVGCAALSLGHPVKAPNRQNESYSYGAAGWLNDVDGVSYRLKSSKENPISRDKEGRSWLYSVKDRYGDVKRWGVLQDEGDMPWYFQGSFVVDDTQKPQKILVTIPSIEVGERVDKYDALGLKVLKFLQDGRPSFASKNKLDTDMRAAGIKFPANDLATALERLTLNGKIVWPEVEGNRSRPGWLAPAGEQ